MLVGAGWVWSDTLDWRFFRQRAATVNTLWVWTKLDIVEEENSNVDTVDLFWNPMEIEVFVVGAILSDMIRKEVIELLVVFLVILSHLSAYVLLMVLLDI